MVKNGKTRAQELIEYPDPRDGDMRGVRAGLIAIVRKYGPMPSHYAYRLYAQQVGINRIGRVIRKTFNKAMSAAVRSGEIVQVDEYGTRTQANQIVRARDAPAVNVRPAMGRNLEEIPPSEIAAVMRRVAERSGSNVDQDSEFLYRGVLQHYGFVRLTKNARSLLDIVHAIHMREYCATHSRNA